MTETTATAPAGAPKSLPARLIGVLLAPRATYAGIAAQPKALGALAVCVLIVVLSTAAFMSTDVGKEAWVDAATRGRTMTDAQYQALDRMKAFAPYISAVSQVVFIPIVQLVISGICLGIFNALLGGDGSFKQVFAVVAHSGAILTLSTMFTLPIAYARETLTGATNLAVFFPFLDDDSIPAHFLGAIDLFWVWWIVSLSIGMGVLYKRRTGPIATTLLGIYVAGALVYALVRAAIAGA